MREKFNPSKKSTYGQNFIYDLALLERLVDACQIEKQDVVLEIGAGAGTLTEVLAGKAKQVISLEIDPSLMPILNVLKERHENLEIINHDFLAWDFEKALQAFETLKVVANIPYYITTPIFHALIFSSLNIEEIACMVQLEVAKKIVATPKNKAEYGTLSLFCQHKFEPEIVEVIGKEHFKPVPKVDSAFVRLVKKKTVFNSAFDEHYYRLVKHAFLHRRKTLTNALKASGYDVRYVEQSLAELELSPNVRAENLSYEHYVLLSQKLLEK